MKPFNRLILCAFLFGGLMPVVAQNNTVPTAGNVGIGTTSPSEALHVKGNVKIDSCLIVQDSAFFTKPIRLANQVEENANYLEAQAFNFTVIDSATNQLKSIAKDDMYAKLLDYMYQPNCGKFQGSPIPNPTWANTENKLFSECLQVNVGIGTAEPNYNLHVVGDSYFGNIVGCNTAPHEDVQLNIRTFKDVGICVNQSSYSDYTYGFKVIVDNETTKSIGVFNESIGKDVFRVMGNGTLWATEIYVDNVEDFPDYVFADDYKLLTFDDLRSYIEANRHLPNIPSAEEVATDDMNV